MKPEDTTWAETQRAIHKPQNRTAMNSETPLTDSRRRSHDTTQHTDAEDGCSNGPTGKLTMLLLASFDGTLSANLSRNKPTFFASGTCLAIGKHFQ